MFTFRARSAAVLTVASLAAAVGFVTAQAPAQATYSGTTEGRLAFGANVGGNVDVYSVLPNGRDLHRLTSDPGFDACPAYSADGKYIAWCATRGTATEVWVMSQSGEDPRQVTHLGGSAIFPDFSPDGSRIVFNALPPGATTPDVFVINSDGTGLVRLTDSPAVDFFPAWSPDGKKIAFVSTRSGIGQVWVMNADGSNQVQLTFDSLPKGQVPDWSPDGSKIAYATETFDIWVINSNGSEQTQLTSGAPREWGTAWSPDGRQVAFTTIDDRLVRVMNADGTDPHIVRPFGQQLVPAWQPRGDRRN
jgi:Tol biopolymer transport system component